MLVGPDPEARISDRVLRDLQPRKSMGLIKYDTNGSYFSLRNS